MQPVAFDRPCASCELKPIAPWRRRPRPPEYPPLPAHRAFGDLT